MADGFRTNKAWINVSFMALIKQATSTANKIQLGVVNSTTAGFALAGAGDGWNFGSFRLVPTSTTALTYQLAYTDGDEWDDRNCECRLGGDKRQDIGISSIPFSRILGRDIVHDGVQPD